MTKRQIIKWLESQSEKALAEVETQSEKALNTYYAERNERIGLERYGNQYCCSYAAGLQSD